MTLRCYADTLTLLEAELAIIDARRPLIVAGITSLRPLVELTSLTGPVEATAATVALSPASTSQETAPPPTAPAVKARRAAPTASVRTSSGTVITDDQIVEAVRQRGPIAPRALATALDIAVDTMRIRLWGLLKAGTLTASGATSNRVYRVPSDPSTPAPAPLAAPPASSLDEVEARDRAILTRLSQGDATFAQLLDVMPVGSLTPSDRETALKSALRRLTLRRRVIDVGAKFRLAA